MIKFNHLYSPATFVYLSGTGNSYRVARWMGECVAEAGGSATLVPLARAGEDALSPPRDPDDPPASGADDGLFGLVCPTHGFTAPWAMIAFALRLPRGRGRRAVAVATRAGVRYRTCRSPWPAAAPSAPSKPCCYRNTGRKPHRRRSGNHRSRRP